MIARVIVGPVLDSDEVMITKAVNLAASPCVDCPAHICKSGDSRNILSSLVPREGRVRIENRSSRSLFHKCRGGRAVLLQIRPVTPAVFEQTHPHIWIIVYGVLHRTCTARRKRGTKGRHWPQIEDKQRGRYCCSRCIP